MSGSPHEHAKRDHYELKYQIAELVIKAHNHRAEGAHVKAGECNTAIHKLVCEILGKEA